jgi:hypothetical protein
MARKRRHRIAVIGSRHYVALPLIHEVLNRVDLGTVIVTGGAQGVDQLVEAHAKFRGHDVVVMAAKWKRDGRAAGLIRNTRVVASADEVIAFWDGQSTGTMDVIRKAHHAGKPLTIYGPTGNLISPEIALGLPAQ